MILSKSTDSAAFFLIDGGGEGGVALAALLGASLEVEDEPTFWVDSALTGTDAFRARESLLLGALDTVDEAGGDLDAAAMRAGGWNN